MSEARAHRVFHVVVVDDDASIRLMVHAMLECDRRLHVVGEAFNGSDAIRLVERTCPDAVVLGMQMPFIDGVTAARMITRACEKTAVIVFSTVSVPTLIQSALDAGVDRYLPKTAPPELLADAIEESCISRQAHRLAV